MRRRCEVRLDGKRVGVIEEIDQGTRFTYDVEYTRESSQPVSVTLPVRAEPYDWPTTLHPFFMNLLPEGWLLEISTKALKISSDDYFGLLSATCADTIGAVETFALEATEP